MLNPIIDETVWLIRFEIRRDNHFYVENIKHYNSYSDKFDPNNNFGVVLERDIINLTDELKKLIIDHIKEFSQIPFLEFIGDGKWKIDLIQE